MRRFALLIALPLAAGSYTNPVMPGDFPGSFRDSRRQRLLGHGDDVAVGADLPAPPFDGSRGLGLRWCRLPDSTFLVRRQLLGAGDRRRTAAASSSTTPPGRKTDRSASRSPTRRRPAGPYTDRGPLVCQEAGSIDAMPVRDENGRRYIVWKEDGNSRKQPTPLWAQPLSDDGLKLIGEKHEILRNEAPWEAHLVEGRSSFAAATGSTCSIRQMPAAAVAATTSWASPARANCSVRGNASPDNPILAGNEQLEMPRPRQHRRRSSPAARSCCITRTSRRRSSTSGVRGCSTR